MNARNIVVVNNILAIVWEDGHESYYEFEPLRRACPCALCKGETNVLAEYTLHNLSDADFTYSGPAIDADNVILAALAPQFGYNPSDANYFIKFRNPVFSFFTAERLLILYSEKGIDGVKNEVQKLRDQGIL